MAMLWNAIRQAATRMSPGEDIGDEEQSMKKKNKNTVRLKPNI